MSKARRKTVAEGSAASDKAARASRAATNDISPVDPVATIVSVIVVALVVVRWLIPAESAADGETLWIVELWFAAGVLWTWSCRRTSQFAVRWGPFDVALWILVGGHIVSTAAVFTTGGDRRSALNLAWEWVGLGASFFLLRQIVSTWLAAKRLATVLAAVGVVLAGLGIWQHYVYYPAAYEEYRKTLSELETLRKDPARNAQRIGKLEFELQAQGVPSDEAARRQFENRLRFSNEPFGPFALANTFSGFLIVSLLFVGELFRAARRPLSTTSVAFWGSVFLLLVYCLVLTKSRTAWVGLALALVWWGGLSLLQGRWSMQTGRRTALVAGGVVAAVVLLFAVAALGGGFDAKVISEAPKSLEYRLQYWRGAIGVIREHPVLGVGPGNFRHHYLRYKVPESSEEIADPHNLVLDLWSSGGVLALAGFLGCVACAIAACLRRRSVEATATRALYPHDPRSKVDFAGPAIGFLLGLAAPLLSASGNFEPVQIVLFLGWLVVFGLLRRERSSFPVSLAPVSGAALGLGVHLMGAGGIEMPAVAQLLLVLAVLAFATVDGDRSPRESSRWVLVTGAASIVLFVSCLVTATLPVLNRRALVTTGEEAMMVDGDTSRAIRDFSEAAVRDPFSPEPCEKLAAAFFAQSGRDGSRSAAGDKSFVKGVESLRMAIGLDPHNPALYRRLGEAYLSKFSRTRDRQEAQEAVDALTQAADRYPNDASLRALRSSALSDAGQAEAAKAEAERALKLDEINRRQNHTDRYLDDATMLRLRHIAGKNPP